MDERELQSQVREAYNLRIGPAMSRYVMEKAHAGGGVAVPVIGADALTGRPRRGEVSLAKLAGGGAQNKSELS